MNLLARLRRWHKRNVVRKARRRQARTGMPANYKVTLFRKPNSPIQYACLEVTRGPWKGRTATVAVLPESAYHYHYPRH